MLSPSFRDTPLQYLWTMTLPSEILLRYVLHNHEEHWTLHGSAAFERSSTEKVHKMLNCIHTSKVNT